MLVIRRTVESDVPDLARIVAGNYNKETAEHFVPEVELSFASVPFRPWFYTAEADGAIVGCGGYGVSWLAYGAFSLFWINVDARRRSRGIGRAIVDHCLLDLRSRATLVLLATSVPDFYLTNWNFQTLTKFHGDQMTDTLMSLELP